MSSREEAIAAHRRGDLYTAEQLYQTLLRKFPENAEILHYMGLLCYQTGRRPEAWRWLNTALNHAPRSVETLLLLIRIGDETGDPEKTLSLIDQYLGLRPNDIGMHNVKGQQLARLGRLREAEQAFHHAAEGTGQAAMFHDLGLCRQWLGDTAGALSAYEEAIRRGHRDPKTKLWRAQCLRSMGRTAEYFQAAMNAMQSVPENIEILIEAQSACRYVCDWESFEHNRERLVAGLKLETETDNGHDIPPGIFNFLEIDEATISAIAKRYASQLSIAGELLRKKLPARRPRGTTRKIRLGYLSTDFFAHAVGYLVRDLFACHDRARFEVHGYSLRHQPDAVQNRIQQGMDVYRNLSGYSAEKIAQSIFDDQIDILIDLAGYTSAARPAVLAARPAPLQISWLGYLGTGGGDFIDYIIADDIALPPALAQNYTERVIRLPRFLAASPLTMAELRPSRKDMGIGKGFLFCSFNQPYKLDRGTFAAWMEILRRAPESYLWLYVPDTAVCGKNLRQEARRLGVHPDRLIFAGHEPMARHVARMAVADLALDPFHISGGATSVAALAAGIPVLTLRGNSFLARMGSSINASLEMNDLDCLEPEQYIAKGVELAMKPTEAAAIKDRLMMALQKKKFFDTKNFVCLLEKALETAWERHAADLPPADIQVSELP